MTTRSAGSARPSLHLRGASFSHSSAVVVLDEVDLDVGPGRHGLVGANGAGKTTVLDLFDGTSTPNRGRVDVHADGPVVRVRQRLGAPTPPVTAFATRWDAEAVTWRRRFDLDVDDLAAWDTRSPGTRMRWQVAAALDARPDVLLLDEPTNHLDGSARAAVVDALAAADVPLVVLVSHDRAVLDAVTDTTLRLVDRRLTPWAGGWSQASRAWAERDRARRAAHDRARHEARRAQRLVAEARTDLSGVERGARASRRRAGARDHDARSSAGKAHAAAAAKSLAGQVSARRSAADRAVEEVAATSPGRRRGAAITVASTVSDRDLLVHLVAPQVAVGDHVVARDVDLAVGPRDRIRIDGSNGAGKTTLVRALVAASRVEVGLLDQDGSSRVGRGAGRRVAAGGESSMAWRDRLLAGEDRHRLLAVLDHLGVDPERMLASAQPTPGEERKLALADLVVRPRPLLVLDEPTNHLDVASIVALQDALADHSAALVLVTHDEALAAAVTERTWRIADGRVRVAPADPDAIPDGHVVERGWLPSGP